MKIKEIIIVFIKALTRLIGLGFLIVGLFSLPSILYDGGFTENIITLFLRLIIYLSYVITGYLLLRVKEKSIIGIIFTIIFSFVVHFYNLYNSNLYNSISQLFVYKNTAFYFIILLFLIFLKKYLFDNNILKQEYNVEESFFKKNKYIILELFFIFLGLLFIYIFYRLDIAGIV